MSQEATLRQVGTPTQRSAAARSLAPTRTPPSRPSEATNSSNSVLAVLSYKEILLEVKVFPKSTHSGLCTAIRTKLNLDPADRLVLVDSDGCDAVIDHTLGPGNYTVLTLTEVVEETPFVKIHMPIENTVLRRCKVLAEILSSERTHIRSFKLINSEFRGPLSDEKRPAKQIIPEEMLATLFPKQLDILLPISEQILTALEGLVGALESALSKGESVSNEESQQVAITVGTLFVENSTFLKHNGNYFNLYSRALDVYVDLVNVSKYGPEGRYGFLLHEATCSALLRDLLILPIQRTLKYPLLLRELFSTLQAEDSAYIHVFRGLAAVQDVAQFCNEEQRKFEEREKVLKLARSFGFSDVVVRGNANELIFDGSPKEVRLKRIHLYNTFPPAPTLGWVFDTIAVFGNMKGGEFSLLADPSYLDDGLEVSAVPPGSPAYQKVFPEKALVRRKSTTFGRVQAMLKGLKPWPQDYQHALEELAKANAYVNSRGLTKIDRHSDAEGLILVLVRPVMSPEQLQEDAAVIKTHLPISQLASMQDCSEVFDENKMSVQDRNLVKSAIKRHQLGKKFVPNLAAMDLYTSKMHFLVVSEEGAPPPPPTGEEWIVAQWVWSEDRHLKLYRGGLGDVMEEYGTEKHLLVDMDLNGKTKFQAEDVSKYAELPNTLSISNAPREQNPMWTYFMSSGDHRQLREEILVKVRPMDEGGEYDVEYIKVGDKARTHYVLEAKYTREAKTTSLFFEVETEQILQTWLGVFEKVPRRPV